MKWLSVSLVNKKWNFTRIQNNLNMSNLFIFFEMKRTTFDFILKSAGIGRKSDKQNVLLCICLLWAHVLELSGSLLKFCFSYVNTSAILCLKYYRNRVTGNITKISSIILVDLQINQAIDIHIKNIIGIYFVCILIDIVSDFKFNVNNTLITTTQCILAWVEYGESWILFL